jgi:PAS domain S-box-containing protein
MQSVDGYIFAFPNATFLRYAEALHRRGRPVMIIGRRIGEVPHILCNNFEATRELIEVLAGRGHGRIGFISGPAENLCASERLRGYRQGLADCGIPFDPAIVFPGDMSETTARDAVASGLRGGAGFTAMIATNDLTAIGAMEAVTAHGGSVPGSVEVIGFDNVPRSHWCSPSLTTFDMQAYQLGHRAVESLVGQIGGLAAPTDQHIRMPLVERGSTRRSADSRRFVSEWTEGEFFCERQLERLCQDSSSHALLQEIRSLDLASPRFGPALQELIAAAGRCGIGPGPLYSLVGDAASRSAGGRAADLSPVFEALCAASVDEQKREIDFGIVFAASTLPLRELSFESVEEGVVIDRLRHTVRELKLRRAGLFLQFQGSEAPFQNQTGTWWDLSSDSPPVSANQPDLAGWGDDGPLPTASVILPLHHRGAEFGQLFLDADTPFLAHFPDLMGQIAAAMHGARMHSALARANRELEASRIEAEEINEQLAKSYEALRSSEYFYHSLVESLPQYVVRKDPEGNFTYVNSAFANAMDRPADEIIGRNGASIYPPELAAQDHSDDLRVVASGQILEFETLVEFAGKKRYLQVKKIPIFGERDECLGVQAIYWDITVFRETEAQLKETQRELMEASRLAGIAEMATGVLHNIGNVLNSVNTSASVAGDLVRNSKIANLTKLVDLLEQNRARLPEFLTTDPRGQVVVDYLRKLAGHLGTEQLATIREFDALREKIEHLNQIVAAQQGYANVAAVTEVLQPAEPVEHASRLSDAALARHRVTLTTEIDPTTPVRVQRQRALQILVNLITNAKEAVNQRVPGDRRIRLCVGPGENGAVRFTVSDNGEGIAPENITRIFAFGFTTKKNGHGFGLHSSALAAKEMAGSLHATSDGNGRGATFVLELPAG